MTFLLLIAGSSAWADFSQMVRKFTMDQLELEVEVTDESGKPLVGAVIWYIGIQGRTPTPGDDVPDLSALSRMGQRYFRQSDFLNTGDIPRAVFERTDAQGIFRDFRHAKPVGAGGYPYFLVATKRGYLPEVVEGDAPLNTRHLVRLRLKPDPATTVLDPRMETFDRIMAELRAALGEDPMSEARMKKLEERYRQTRELAEALEKENKADEASAVYWALADFPAVTRVVGQDGRPQITGYQNGRNDPQAEADRVRAIKLNRSVPKLLLSQQLMARGFPYKGISSDAHARAFLDAFDTLAQGNRGQQILPIDYRVAIRQTLRWNYPARACALMQQAYRMEPAILSIKGWWEFLEHYQRLGSGVACVIEGLPVPADVPPAGRR